jgi:hypothetical protein
LILCFCLLTSPLPLHVYRLEVIVAEHVILFARHALASYIVYLPPFPLARQSVGQVGLSTQIDSSSKALFRGKIYEAMKLPSIVFSLFVVSHG